MTTPIGWLLNVIKRVIRCFATLLLKIFKSFAFLGVGVLILFAVWGIYDWGWNKLDRRPFKFEQYKTYEEFEKAVLERFPLGSHWDDVVDVLEQSGARCTFPERIERSKYLHNRPGVRLPETTHVNECNYTAFIFSGEVSVHYSIRMQADEDDKIIYFDTSRWSGFWVI